MDSLIEPSSLTGLEPDTISISNVNLSLGTGAARVHILKDISLRVASGEAIGLIGPSGSGKSTLLMVMAGLERPDSGEVVVNGTPFNALDEDALARFRGRQVGIVFQSFHLIPTMTALENVAVPLELAGSPDAAERAAKELASVGLGERLHHYPTQLSGGEQQRVALARALAPRPRLMLLDEPFSSLDATLREHVREDAIAVLRATGTPVLMVTHEADEAVRVADQIHVMLDGHILQSGTPAQLYARPASPFVASFFGPLNRFKGWVIAGMVSTPLGPIEAADLADGTPVVVLIRPEALRLLRDGGASPFRFRVQRVRDLGTNRLLELELPGGPPLTVRLTSAAEFIESDVVAVEVDPSQVYVYRSPAVPQRVGP
jgi:putative ABC transport system ATP-binding protein